MDTATKLAFERTYLANERTQMAWIRTSLALISFGFTIAHLHRILQPLHGAKVPYPGPRAVGIMMIVVGLAALVSGNVQHYRSLKALRAECPSLPRSTAGAIAALIMLLGITAFVLALLQ
jgi:putative membrane protein